jgi:hypothetical protein
MVRKNRGKQQHAPAAPKKNMSQIIEEEDSVQVATFTLPPPRWLDRGALR